MNSRSSVCAQKLSSFVGIAESGTKSRWKGLGKRVGEKWVSQSDAKTSRMVDALFTLKIFLPRGTRCRMQPERILLAVSLLGERCTD